jgi:hypothetical protein
LAGHVTWIGKHATFWWENLLESHYLKDQGGDKRITLIWILEKQNKKEVGRQHGSQKSGL